MFTMLVFFLHVYHLTNRSIIQKRNNLILQTLQTKMNHFVIMLLYIKTWILYRGREEGVSKVVEDAYRHYENIEFWMKPDEINDQKRHIKLIDISGKKVFSN